MSNRLMFVFDNLKVTIHPGDRPYPGFDILAGEVQCSVKGTLFDVGYNAGFIPEGNTKVRGQLWSENENGAIAELKEFIDTEGNVCLTTSNVTITEDKDSLVVPAIIFALKRVPDGATRIDSGYWAVRGYKRK